MQKYIEHIHDIASSDSAYTTPVPIDVKTMANLFAAFEDELMYIEYKYILNKEIEVSKEIANLKALYVFNYIIKHAYNWMTVEMSVYMTKRRCDGKGPLSLQDIVFNQCSIMGDYAFYDGRSYKEVYEEVENLKNNNKSI